MAATSIDRRLEKLGYKLTHQDDELVQYKCGPMVAEYILYHYGAFGVWGFVFGAVHGDKSDVHVIGPKSLPLFAWKLRWLNLRQSVKDWTTFFRQIYEERKKQKHEKESHD